MEEFIDAMAEYYDARREREEFRSGVDYDGGYCAVLHKRCEELKVEAEVAMRKVIQTELKLVINNG